MKEIRDWHLFQWGTPRYQNYLRKWIPASIIIGFFSGIAMSFFIYFIQSIGVIVVKTIGIPLGIIIAGGITAVIVKMGYEEVEGPGIGYLLEHKNKHIPIPPRAIATRFTASGVSLGAGIPGGREGPAFLMGGTIAYYIGKKVLKMNEQELNLAVTLGCAASTSSIFQAPLGGTLFASEVPYRQDIEFDVYIPAFMASITGVIIYLILGEFLLKLKGFDLSFDTTPLPITVEWMLLISSFGIIIGLFSLIYSFLLRRLTYVFQRVSESWERIFISAILLAIIIWITGFFVDVPFSETGFELLELLVENDELKQIEFVLILFLLKAIIILLVISGGNAVGIFSPTLVLGALLGTLFAITTGHIDYIGDFFILGMAGMQSGTAKTPIASMVLILEITGLPHLILYMAIVTTLAYIVSGEQGLYKDQLTDRREAIRQKLETKDYLEDIPIEAVMTEKVITLNPNMTVFEVKAIFQSANKHTLPIVDDTNKVIGITSMQDIRHADDTQKISDYMIKDVITLEKTSSLKDALEEVLKHEVERFPIVNEEKKLVGFITLHDMLTTYQKHERVERKLS
ncbi:MAG: chloride channel protein [Candidatus Hodarchaeales archaeon]|jgi:CIC family chloride channel protein